MKEMEIEETMNAIRHYLMQMQPEHRDDALRNIDASYLRMNGSFSIVNVHDIPSALEWAFDWDEKSDEDSYWLKVHLSYAYTPCIPYDANTKYETELPTTPFDSDLL
jgi:hypothetical protein